MGIAFIALHLITGFWGMYVAQNRNRNQFAWFIACALFGVWGVLLVALLPSVEEQKVIKKRAIKRKK